MWMQVNTKNNCACVYRGGHVNQDKRGLIFVTVPAPHLSQWWVKLIQMHLKASSDEQLILTDNQYSYISYLGVTRVS